MAKVRLGPKPFLLPQPAVLVGTFVEGRPNAMMASWCGVVNHTPPMVSVAVRPSRHTQRGILENREFSLNIPRTSSMEVADYCGIASGAKEDKSQVFTYLGGVLERAPLIGECPVALECRLVESHEFPTHHLHVGEVVEVHADETCLVDGAPELGAVDPLVYSFSDGHYWKVGERLARAFQSGKALRS